MSDVIFVRGVWDLDICKCLLVAETCLKIDIYPEFKTERDQETIMDIWMSIKINGRQFKGRKLFFFSNFNFFLTFILYLSINLSLVFMDCIWKLMFVWFLELMMKCCTAFSPVLPVFTDSARLPKSKQVWDQLQFTVKYFQKSMNFKGC